MEVRGNVPNEEAFKKFRAKKRTLTETRTVNNNPKKLEEKSKPDDGMIELEGGSRCTLRKSLNFRTAQIPGFSLQPPHSL